MTPGRDASLERGGGESGGDEAEVSKLSCSAGY